MKKYLIGFITLIASIIVAVIVFNPSGATSQKKSDVSLNTSIPDDVKKILENSCMGCHGDGGNPMAMGMINFSIWDTYSVKKQHKKSSAVCNAITNGNMPPSSVSADKRPTATQIAIICKWASGLPSK